jgi:hypothetical protein
MGVLPIDFRTWINLEKFSANTSTILHNDSYHVHSINCTYSNKRAPHYFPSHTIPCKEYIKKDIKILCKCEIIE